jgi:Ca-activated chloride channel family protein
MSEHKRLVALMQLYAISNSYFCPVLNEDLLMPMAKNAGGNAWHVEQSADMQKIFAVELEGLIAQFAHTVTLGLIPSDTVQIADVLNDFELNENGRYKLPNLQAGAPVDVLVRLRVSSERAGERVRLLDVRLGYTPHIGSSFDTAVMVKRSFEIEFDAREHVESLPVNDAVEEAVQLLMNARARREAAAQMDAGNFAAAHQVIQSARQQTEVLFARAPSSPHLGRESARLTGLEESLKSRGSDRMSRKRLLYDAHARSHSKKLD